MKQRKVQTNTEFKIFSLAKKKTVGRKRGGKVKRTDELKLLAK
jgi:hypothetical protein